MRWTLGALAATAFVGAASAASADEITGKIQNIDPAVNRFTVNGTVFVASPWNTVGAQVADLRLGDRVKVFYGANSSERQPWNAMVIKKIG